MKNSKLTFKTIRDCGDVPTGIKIAKITSTPVNKSAAARLARNQYGGFLKLFGPLMIAIKMTAFSSTVRIDIAQAIISAKVTFLSSTVPHFVSSILGFKEWLRIGVTEFKFI